MDRAELIANLTRLGISRVEIKYDGQGDEGYVNDINLYDLEGADVTGTSQVIGMNKQLDELAYELLEQHHPGWEINEGAFGTITIDVTTGQINNNYNERYESSTESNETW